MGKDTDQKPIEELKWNDNFFIVAKRIRMEEKHKSDEKIKNKW